jgi:hypothetical protein
MTSSPSFASVPLCVPYTGFTGWHTVIGTHWQWLSDARGIFIQIIAPSTWPIHKVLRCQLTIEMENTAHQVNISGVPNYQHPPGVALEHFPDLAECGPGGATSRRDF